MVALAYEKLGGISSVSENPKVPASKRSRDRNDKQRLAFECDSAKPFTGIIHVQASVGDPGKPDADNIWFDIAEMTIDNEGGSWSYEPIGEFASLRVVCKAGNYWSAAHGAVNGLVGTAGDFTINGITITVSAGDTALTTAGIINATGGIITDGTIIADVVNTSQLRIYKTDGAPLILNDTTATPLADLGITPGTFNGGVIESISMLR